jgi:hypothetical protein
MEITIKSRSKQSNSAYHRTGKPTWWAAYDLNGKRTFITVPYTRGDVQLVATVEVPEGVTEIIIGAGKTGAGKACDTYRETITIVAVEA